MNKNKINRNKISKYLARFGLIIMSFVIMIPMLCSASDGYYTVSYTLSNPDNIPQDLTVQVDHDSSDSNVFLEFGSGSFESNLVVNISDGVMDTGDEVAYTTIPDGTYLLCGIQITQPSGYSSTLDFVGGAEATYTYLDYTIPCYYSDSIDLVVVERDNSLQLVDSIVVFVSLPSPPPNPTDSITNVWTDMLNWFTSALNSVSSLFVTKTTDNTVLPGTYTFNESFDGDFPDYILDENSTDYVLNYSYNGSNYSILACGSITASAGSSSSIVNMLAFGTYDNPEPLIIYSYSIVNGEVAPSGNGYQVDTPVQITIFEAQSVSPLMMQILSDYTDYGTVNVSSGSSYELTPIGTLVILSLAVAISLLILRRVVMYFQLH